MHIFLTMPAMLMGVCGALCAADWKPVESTVITEAGAQVSPTNAWKEYPRPALVRDAWTNLNGLWDWAVTAHDAAKPTTWSGRILVPFCLEAPLSGVGRLLKPNEALWYHRTFSVDAKPGKRVLLHFEAVDYECQVMINNKEVGKHVGGSTPFFFDITDVIQAGDNVLELRVLDATGGWQLKGKQDLHPGGITYTRVSGIWQTVWLEQIPERAIAAVHTTWDETSKTVTCTPTFHGTMKPGDVLHVVMSEEQRSIAEVSGSGPLALRVEAPRLWSTQQPFLYDLTLELRDGNNQIIDQVTSYTGLRTVAKVRDAQGHWRFTLNSRTIFHWGPLDQGWWPDGLLTPPSEAAMRSDIEFLKAAGFNMIRKHIKIEPRRYYYDCDRMGMLVWQDQVSGGKSPAWDKKLAKSVEATWPDDAHEQWVIEYKRMVDHLRSHPSIVVWTPFNEAWGQHRVMEIGKMAVEYDTTRQVNIASGGNFFSVGDIVDMHSYPHPSFPRLDDARFTNFIKVIGEFGGHGFPVEGHLWNPKAKNWGYGGLPKNKEEWISRYTTSITKLAELRSKGVAAGVYTQTTDCEGEINGLLTYDRKVQKLSPQELAKIHTALGTLEGP